MTGMDNEWVFSDNAAPSALTQGNRISTNVHQLRLDPANATTGVDFVAGKMPPRFFAVVTAAPTDTGSTATMNLQLVSATNAALTAGVVVHRQTGVLAFDDAAFALGAEIVWNLDPNQLWFEFVGVRTVIAVEDLLTFSYTAALVDSIDSAVKKYATRMVF